MGVEFQGFGRVMFTPALVRGRTPAEGGENGPQIRCAERTISEAIKTGVRKPRLLNLRGQGKP